MDKLERATTLQQMEHEMSFPTAYPETDCFLAWEGERLVGFTDLYVRNGDAQSDGVIYCWGVVHPGWRRRGLGRRLSGGSLRARDASTRPAIEGRDRFTSMQHPRRRGGPPGPDTGFGMERVRFFVNLARPLNGNVPPVEVPAGIRLRNFDPEQDAETVWRVDNPPSATTGATPRASLRSSCTG